MKKRINFLFIPFGFLLALAVIPVAAAPRVEKVEPPNWWAGHTIDPVRVLVRGSGFRGAEVRSADKNLRVGNVRVNANGTYVFFDVRIDPDTPVGKYGFELRSGAGMATVPFEISEKLDPRTNFRGVGPGDVIYLIMPDRFANGDTSNDEPADAPPSANDRSNIRAWHGGDLKGVTSKLPYLKELGVTALWLTPWYDNPNTANECDKPWCPYTNFHGYHAIDYYAVEDRLGTMEDLREMVREAHKLGIKIIQDQVANHVGVQHVWSKEPPLENWFSEYSPNTFNNSVLLSPNASPAERRNLLMGWFNDLLPDNNHYEPEVVKYQLQNALWWIGMTGIDGIRQDTIQYMPREFIRDWSIAIKREYPDFWMVGEVFEEDSAQTAFFQGGHTGWDGIDTQLPSVFDFHLWRTSQKVFTGKKPARSLRDVLKYDGLYPDINRVVLLENNHDTERFMSLEGATREGSKLHKAFVLSARGIPQLYYGEEILMTGGHDPDNRKDFPGGWSEDKIDKFNRAGRTAEEQDMFEWTQKWIELRKTEPALSHGRTTDLFYDDTAYIFERRACYHGECRILVGFNNADAERTLRLTIVPTRHFNMGADLTPLIAEPGRVKILEKRPSEWWVELTIPAKTAVAYRIGRVDSARR